MEQVVASTILLFVRVVMESKSLQALRHRLVPIRSMGVEAQEQSTSAATLTNPLAATTWETRRAHLKMHAGPSFPSAPADAILKVGVADADSALLPVSARSAL